MPFLLRPDGCRLYYEVEGPDAGPPLLLLEGLGASLEGWRHNLPGLAQRYRVVGHDFRGNGRSDKPDAHLSISLLAEDSLAMMDHLAIPSAHLYGQSLGGMVALEMALSDQDRVRSLILAATHGGHSGAFHRLPWKVPKSKPFVMLYSRSFLRRHPERVAEDLRLVQARPQPPGIQRRQWEAIHEWDAWERLGEIRVPTLILHGTEDRLVPPENGIRLAELIPGAELHLLDGAGHVYHWERPEEADRAVVGFLDRVEGSR